MIESIMYFAMGFLVASIGVMVVSPLVHARAVRLTTRRLESVMPASMAEIVADKDHLRAEFAMSTQRLELKIEELKTKRAGQLAELGNKDKEINRLKVELGDTRDQLGRTQAELASKHAALDDAERALSDKGSELAALMDKLDARSAAADARHNEIIALETEVKTLKERLLEAGDELKALDEKRGPERIELDAALQKVITERSEFENESVVLKAQIEVLQARLEAAGNELTALKERRDAEADAALQKVMEERGKVETLQRRVTEANNELMTLQESRDAARAELEEAKQKLMQQHGKFEDFHSRAAELVQQLMAEPPDVKIQDLENRLLEQTRLFTERECELKHLRNEIEVVRKAEADHRSSANAAIQTLNVEKAKLQGALERAKGERVRLGHEIAKLKQQVIQPIRLSERRAAS